MAQETTFSFTTYTKKFCIAGLLIPGLTAFPILGLQMGIERLGFECSASWSLLWAITSLGLVVAPTAFVLQMISKLHLGRRMTTFNLLMFNITEYIFIQASLAFFFTTGKTLCYVGDGQNGIEFVFTGWMSLPILLVLSLFFDKLWERKTRSYVE
jgi:hypothetical protein